MTPRSGEITALSEAIVAAARVRIPMEQLWQLWTSAAPRLHGDPRQGAALAAALAILGERGTIDLPANAWDRSTDPPLPRSVTVPSARTAQRTMPWISFPWCRQLGWAASLPTLASQSYDDLVAINAWLVATNGGSTPVVPMRYRSAALFGDEKRLEKIMRTNLFGDGRLSLTLLACTRIPPPLAAARVGDGPDILVMENSDPYWVAVRVLKATAAHPVGLVVWGAGKSFPSQVPTLAVDVAGYGPTRGTVWYWGDMDPNGLAIAAEAARLSKLAGGPPIRPAHRLWEAMADRPIQRQGHVDWANTEAGHAWLGTHLSSRLNSICTARARVAQETVPTNVIALWAEALDIAGSACD